MEEFRFWIILLLSAIGLVITIARLYSLFCDFSEWLKFFLAVEKRYRIALSMNIEKDERLEALEYVLQENKIEIPFHSVAPMHPQKGWVYSDEEKLNLADVRYFGSKVLR